MYSTRLDKKQVIVNMSGSIQVAVALSLREEMLDLADKGYSEFIFDVKDVEYMDSTGLGVFISVKNHLQGSDGKVKVTGAQGKVEKLMTMTRLKEIFCAE